MDDLISRQAAIDALAKNMPSLTTPDGCGQFDHDIYVTDEAYVDCMQIIHDMPSAQPERKKGKWHRRFYPQIEMMVCSECQEEFSYDAETGIRDYNYCPNCGADMKEVTT